MKNKFFIIAYVLVALIFSNSIFATYDTTLIDIKEKPTLQMQIDDNSYFSKELINKNEENKSLTFRLQVQNNEPVQELSGEIMFVIDMSNSMETWIDENGTRKEAVLNSANTLINSLLENNDNLKIGVVSFATSNDIYQEGTIADANVVCPLDNNAQNITNAVSNMQSTGPRTDLQAGVALAKQQFSQENNNKYMIILSDGTPNVAFDFDSYYSDKVIENTKNELLDTKEKNITTIAMLTGIDDADYSPMGQDKTFSEILNEIFNNDTVNSFYNIQDSEIEETITQNILTDIKPIEKILNNIKIVDNFSQEIVDNFNITYSPVNIGTVSDITNNSLTWNIEELKVGEAATLEYTLTLKEDYNTDILDKLINVNNSTNITYLDYEQSSDITTKIMIADPPATSDISFIIILPILMISSIAIMFMIKRKSSI